MMRPVRFGPGLVVAAAALAALVACAPVQVNTFVRPEAETARYLTYEWERPEVRYVGDPRLDGSSVFEGYVTAAIDEQLRVRGLEPAAIAMADLRVRWAASVTQRAYASDRGAGTHGGGRVDLFDEGALVIDLIDARTDRLIWRGAATTAIDGVVADQARMERRLHDAIARILQRLPPGVGRTAPPL